MAARPATRHIRERQTPDLQARAPVRDLNRGSASFRIDWDVRPAYDFVFSLSGDAGSTEDLPAADRTWLADAKASMPANVQEATSGCSSPNSASTSPVVVVGPPGRSAPPTTSSPRSRALEPRGRRPRRCSRRARASQSSPASSTGRSTAIRRVLPAIEEILPEHGSDEARLAILREPEQTVADLRRRALCVGRSGSRRSNRGSPRSSNATTRSRAADRRASRRSTSSSARPTGSAGCRRAASSG